MSGGFEEPSFETALTLFSKTEKNSPITLIWCTAGMGVILWDVNPPYVNPESVKLQNHKYQPKARAVLLEPV